MVTANWQEKPQNETRKTGHCPPSNQKLLSANAVLIDVLKVMELELQKRRILPTINQNSFHPVWFLAETERNIFLWRHGCSLIEQDDFEFWIDLRSLVEKRLRSLERFDPENPFLNPLWGGHISQSDAIEREKSYLEKFESVIASIEQHATALCQVASMVLQELCPAARDRETVLLPVLKKPPIEVP